MACLEEGVMSVCVLRRWVTWIGSSRFPCPEGVLSSVVVSTQSSQSIGEMTEQDQQWTGLRWSPGPMVLAGNSRDPVKPYISPETLTENTTNKAPGHSLFIKATRSHSQSLRNLHKISSWGLEWVLVLRRHFPMDGCTHSDEKTASLIVLGAVVCSFLKCSVEVACIKQRTLGLHACYLNGWIQV